MKNYITVLLLLSMVTLSAFTCKKKGGLPMSSCYKGRLEVKGTCMNYTIKVLEGDVRPDRIEKNWKDPSTGKEHTNVFRLENICNFPSTLKEGDEFYFVLENNPSTECFRCLAFYPTPAKGMSIKVITGTCSDKRD